MQQPPRTSPPTRNRIAALLLEARLVSAEQLRTALQEQAQWGGRLTRRIDELGFAGEEALTAALERGLRVPRVHLARVRPPAAALARVDAAFAEGRGVLPVEFRDGGRTLLLAMADPTDVGTIDEVARRAQVRVQPAVAGDRELEAAIRRHYHGEAEAAPPVPEEAVGAEARETWGGESLARDTGGRDAVARDAVADLVLASAPAASAADVLEELLAGAAASPDALTAEERHRLELVRQNQERSGRLLRGLLELLLEKGVLRNAELIARLRS